MRLRVEGLFIRLLLTLNFLVLAPSYCDIFYPDFDTSMLKIEVGIDRVLPGYIMEQKKNYGTYSNIGPLALFRKIYNSYAKSADLNNIQTFRIPLIIHQIWLGSPVPEGYQKWIEKFKSLTGWQYYLWTEKEVSKLRLYNRDLYEKETNFGYKSDILRFELLYKFGGVYIDLDTDLARPKILEKLHSSFDLYMGFETTLPSKIHIINGFKSPILANTVVGAIPEHPLVYKIISGLKAKCKSNSKNVSTPSPVYITALAYEYESSSPPSHKNIYLPCTFFYPVWRNEMKAFRHMNQYAWIPEETVLIPYWHGSWKKNAHVKNDIWEEFYEKIEE